jgi:hypothetical protein
VTVVLQAEATGRRHNYIIKQERRKYKNSVLLIRLKKTVKNYLTIEVKFAILRTLLQKLTNY